MKHPLALGLLLGALGSAQTAPAIRVDAAQLVRDVEALAADDMQGRLPGTQGSNRARAYLIGRLKEAGVRPLGKTFERPFTFASAGTGARQGINLVGVIPGSRNPDRYIVVTAHYDHLGVQHGEIFNGADDNASGVAALLAVGAHFSRAAPEHSLLLVATDAEELGLQGAYALMRDPPVPVSSMIVNVNIDMVGRDPGNRLFATGVHHWPFLKPYLEKVAQPPVVLAFGHDTPDDPQDWTRDSDHFVFHQAGIPWIYFGVEDFDQHHRTTDDPATINRELLTGAAVTAIRAVQQFDLHLEAIAAQRVKK